MPENTQDKTNYSTVNSVTGTPVCAGSIKGRACVINNLKEIHQLQKGIYNLQLVIFNIS